MGTKPVQARFAIESLSDRHHRTTFSCGVEALDSYLHRQAGQDTRKRVAVTFVATADGKTVAGYYTLSQYAIQLDAVPEEILRKLPKYPMVPTTLVGRLAVRLMDALHRSFALSEQVASAGAMVDAKDESAVSCYRKYGFLELP